MNHTLTTGTLLSSLLLGAWRPAFAQSPWTIYSGAASPPEPLIHVKCGALEFQFDPKLAFVRYIKWQGVEVVRGIYAAVRDQVWGTVAPRVSNVVVTTEADAFRLRFDVDCKQGDIDFAWNGVIEGAPRELRFEMQGDARSTFLRNRIGFCVLHPLAECAGKPCRVEKADGSTVNGAFPDFIAPHQPFKDMKLVSHAVMDGVMAEVRFSGDLFEMEDHRNWTDGNFKSYCTPLAWQ